MSRTAWTAQGDRGEGRRLRIKNSRYYSLGRIREAVPSLAEGSVLIFPAVQKEMTSLNRSAGLRVAPCARRYRSWHGGCRSQCQGSVSALCKRRTERPLQPEYQPASVTARFATITVAAGDSSVNFHIRLAEKTGRGSGSWRVTTDRFRGAANRCRRYGVHADSNVAVLGTTQRGGQGAHCGNPAGTAAYRTGYLSITA